MKIFILFIYLSFFINSVNSQNLNYTIQITNPPPCTACCNGSIQIGSITWTCLPVTYQAALFTPTSPIPLGGIGPWGNLCNGIYTVQVSWPMDTTGCALVCVIFWGYGSPTTQLHEKLKINLDAIKLFPNPANDFLNLELPFEFSETNYSIQIFNNMGQAIKEDEIIINKKIASIKTRDLSNGIYFLRLKINGQTVNKFLVLDH